jgi:tetratricopeptide (TPR) repeat protein
VEAAEGQLPRAVELYEQAVRLQPQPERLAALGDLHLLLGQTEAAETRYEQLRAIVRLESDAGRGSRAGALFLANHGESAELAVQLAEAELESRRDVYSLDAHAWALLSAGRPAEAAEQIRLARAHGTQDPLLDYHGAMIALALGDREDGQRLLEAALDGNPGFDPLQAERARQALAELMAGR